MIQGLVEESEREENIGYTGNRKKFSQSWVLAAAVIGQMM